METAAIRRSLARWYDASRRDLPWRRTRDPYAIWISEIMLQQTRVAAVIPYYERFLARFPTVEALAAAPETDVLTLWSGLGYYSRARNLQKAARQMVSGGGFPRDYDGIRGLAGVGDYTAAAVGSIAFGLPYPVIDGNVRRVLARLTNDNAVDFLDAARGLLDAKNPARSNQALMELGAVVCVPGGDPRCGICPVATYCEAKRHGTAAEIPVTKVKSAPVIKERVLLVIRRTGRILLVPGTRVAGFWDLPEPEQLTSEGLTMGCEVGAFRHSITNSQYRFKVMEASVRNAPKGSRWVGLTELEKIPLSTAAKKALRCL